MNALLIIMVTLIAPMMAAAQSNYYGFTQEQISTAYSISGIYGITTYVEERNAFNSALNNYFIDVNHRYNSRSLKVLSYVREREGVWWESTVAKRSTVYRLRFQEFLNGQYPSKECTVKFSREEAQAGSSEVKVQAGSLVCVNL